MMCTAAPLMEYSGDQDFLRKNEEFAHTIKSDVVELKDLVRKEYSIGPDNELQLIRELLAIPQVTLNCHSSPCSVEDCFNQIRAGLHTFDGYLSQMTEVLPYFADRVRALQLDVRNLSDNIQLQMEETGLPTVTYPPANQVLTNLGNQKQVGSYIILDYLKGFLEMTIRALRHCSA